MIQWRKIISFDFHHIPKLSIGFKGSMTHLQNIVGGQNKVIVTWNDSLWWQTLKLLNSLLHATFDWQSYNFLLKVSVQMVLANKKIKRKSGLKLLFLISKLKGFEFLNFNLQYSSNVRSRQKPHAEEISWRSGVLANVSHSLPLKWMARIRLVSEIKVLWFYCEHLYGLTEGCLIVCDCEQYILCLNYYNTAGLTDWRVRSHFHIWPTIHYG